MARRPPSPGLACSRADRSASGRTDRFGPTALRRPTRLGGRNHSTVISAEKKVIAWLKADDQCHPLAGFETVADVLGSLERALGA